MAIAEPIASTTISVFKGAISGSPNAQSSPTETGKCRKSLSTFLLIRTRSWARRSGLRLDGKAQGVIHAPVKLLHGLQQRKDLFLKLIEGLGILLLPGRNHWLKPGPDQPALNEVFAEILKDRGVARALRSVIA